MRRLTPKELEIGMIIAEPVTTPLGQLLAEKDTEVTRQLINRMKLYRVEYAMIQIPPNLKPIPLQAKPIHRGLLHLMNLKTFNSNIFKVLMN